MLLEPEEGGAAVLGPVAADPLEGTDAVMQRVRKDMDLRGVPVDEFPVQPDLLCLGDHGSPPEGLDVLFLQRCSETVNPGVPPCSERPGIEPLQEAAEDLHGGRAPQGAAGPEADRDGPALRGGG